jgi:hypothetical protein
MTGFGCSHMSGDVIAAFGVGGASGVVDVARGGVDGVLESVG